MPNTPLNKEELKQRVLEPFWNIARMSQSTAPDGGDEWIVTKKDFNAYADRVTEMFFADRAAAIREALKSVKSIAYPPSGKEYWFIDGTFENSLIGAARKALELQSQPNAKEDSDE